MDTCPLQPLPASEMSERSGIETPALDVLLALQLCWRYKYAAPLLQSCSWRAHLRKPAAITAAGQLSSLCGYCHAPRGLGRCQSSPAVYLVLCSYLRHFCRLSFGQKEPLHPSPDRYGCVTKPFSHSKIVCKHSVGLRGPCGACCMNLVRKIQPGTNRLSKFKCQKCSEQPVAPQVPLDLPVL